MVQITAQLAITDLELEFTYVASPGPGGQNVNKVATAVQLRFNVWHSPSLPEAVRRRLVQSLGKRLTTQGDLLIKASRFRTQERNKQDALGRFCDLIKGATLVPKKRRKTKPTKASIQRRLATKKRHSLTKSLRRNKRED